MRIPTKKPLKYATRWICDSCGCELLSWGSEVRKKCYFKKCNGWWMRWEPTSENPSEQE